MQLLDQQQWCVLQTCGEKEAENFLPSQGAFAMRPPSLIFPWSNNNGIHWCCHRGEPQPEFTQFM